MSQQEPKQQHSEQAKKKPHISAREYIRWPPHEPYENTNTLVVTSAGDRFVDIRARLYRPHIEAQIAPGVRPSDFLEWAFAGVASNYYKNGTMYASWRHLVDSTTSRPDQIVDQGVMIPMGGGRTLEKGKMVNPLQREAGEQEYEEGWIEVPMVSQRADGKLETVVLQLMDEERNARGMVVRVGHVCQGIMRVGIDYTCERWLWTQQEGWKRMFRDGQFWLPTGLALEMEKLNLDDEIVNMELSWKVVEIGLSD